MGNHAIEQFRLNIVPKSNNFIYRVKSSQNRSLHAIDLLTQFSQHNSVAPYSHLSTEQLQTAANQVEVLLLAFHGNKINK